MKTEQRNAAMQNEFSILLTAAIAIYIYSTSGGKAHRLYTYSV